MSFDLDREDNRYLFTNLGLRSLASQAPLGDLLQYRLVSKEWNEVVQKQAKFKKAHVTFDPDWIQMELIPFYGSSLEPRKWTNVKLNRTRLPGTSAHLYLSYWRNSCEPLKVLDVYRVQVTSDNLCKIINSSPNLEELTINHVRFAYQDSSRIVGLPDRFGQVKNTKVIDRSFCTCDDNDQDILSKIFTGKDTALQLNTRPTLKKIKLLGFFALPCTLLEILVVRSRGQLVEFKIIKWFGKPKKVTGDLFPENITQRGGFLRIIRGSETSLSTFHFIDNEARESSLLFVNMIQTHEGEAQVLVPKLQFEEIEIRKDLDTVIDRFGRVTRTAPIAFNQRAIQLIANQVGTVRRLKLSLGFGPNFDELYHLMSSPVIIQDLQSFELHFIGALDPRPNMNFLGRLRVSHLALCDTKGYYVPRNFVRNFNAVGLEQLPRLTSLKLRLLGLSSNQIRDILSNQNLTGLTSLEFMGSRNLIFNDDNFLMIIQNMPKLKKLHIINASTISEFGTTGLRREVIAELEKSKIFHGHPSDYDENIVELNMRQLEDLEDLSLKGCIKVGNITLFFGILFPKLKKLDLSECPEITDNGIQYVGRNLNLEELTIRKNIKLTFYGINQLVKDYPHIRKIYTSKSTIGRKLESIENKIHPFFPQVVKSYSEVVREAKMENKPRRQNRR